jgi:cell division protein FtsN
MEYQFSFTRLRLLLLCLAVFCAGMLILAIGIVAGIGLGTPRDGKPAAALAGKANPKAQLASAKSALKVPALPGAAAVAEAAAPVPAAPEAAAPVPAAPAPVPAAAVTETAPAALPVAAAASAAVLDVASQPFVLQLGAFREQKSAKLLQTALKEKGYVTTIFNMVDEDQRTWHMVRLGGFKDLPAASKAASDFTGKEGIQALVRRSDSL